MILVKFILQYVKKKSITPDFQKAQNSLKSEHVIRSIVSDSL